MPVVGIGRHAVKVVSHALGRSSTGTPHVAVLFEDVQGDRITWYGYLSDAAIERTIKSLQLLGWDAVASNGMVDTLNGTGLLVGNEAEIVVDTEVYNGEVRHKVKWVNEPGGGMVEAMPQDDASSFAATLRAKVLSAPRPKPNSQPGPAKAVAVAPDDDGLPF
jgi:hypothetical protein